MNRQGNLKVVLAAVLAMGLAAITPARAQTAIGGNWQVFTDMSLIQTLTDAVLKQHEPGQRPNGTGSVNAGYFGGEMITKPFTFTGRRLVLNYATSAAGSIRVEIQDGNGTPISGYALANFPERYLDEVEGVMSWSGVMDVGSLAGTTIRLRFVLKDADLYAMRFANPDNVQYSVSYNANGANGGGLPATQTKEKGVSLVLSMNVPNSSAVFLYKTGYTFAGWNTAADGTGTSYAECATYTTDANLALYARWAANPTTYTVTFNKNGATSGWGPAALNKIQGVGLTLPSNISLAKTGYTFAGWNTAANGAGTDYAVGTSYPTDAAITLYAKWVGQTDAPTITAGPVGITVTAGQTATFSVTASGTPPLAYQWYKNDAVIGGATALSYTTPATTTNDNGAAFKVTVTNAYGAVTSSVATLTVNAAPTGASGGTVMSAGGYTYHIFTSSGTFANYSLSAVDVFVVAGGGGAGGGKDYGTGGGGAGGVILSSAYSVTAGSSYTVTVGSGGAGGTGDAGYGSVNGQNGGNSWFDVLQAYGGGGGGNADGTNGLNGGCGGGGAGTGSGGLGTTGQGKNGGNGLSAASPWTGGGGGGCVQNGYNGDAAAPNGGRGGDGTNMTTWLNGLALGDNGYFAGGGGAGSWDGPAGVSGIGGGGSEPSGDKNGRANTGGGGGGRYTTASPAGNGGSGIVIVRYVSGGGSDPFETWRQENFTSGQLNDPAYSGATADPDYDGLNNQQEYWAGTNPTNTLSCLVLYAPTNNIAADGKFVVRWQSVTGKTYTVMATTNLLSAFTNVITNVLATPTVNVYTDNVGNAMQRFYRVKVE